MRMQKIDYITMISDNVMVFGIKLPPDIQGEKLNEHLNKFDEKHLGIIAGFNKDFLEHFLIVSKGKTQKDLEETLKKMESISYMINPSGPLGFLSSDQIQYILTKLGGLKMNEITEQNIGSIADEQLEKQFGGSGFNVAQALENQLATAAFYLTEMGYTEQEIQEKFKEVRQDPAKLDAIFNIKPKEIYSLPPELRGAGQPARTGSSEAQAVESEGGQENLSEQSKGDKDIIERHISSITHEISADRLQKVDEILNEIKEIVREKMTGQYEKVFRQIHPDRLITALKMIKDAKRKPKRLELYLDWFFFSFLLESIEFKVEHWQTSANATQGTTGVYTAGISFSRYDPIVREFDDGKLTKVINIARKILQNPQKRAIQKLGQDLIAETGFDEHLYFID